MVTTHQHAAAIQGPTLNLLKTGQHTCPDCCMDQAEVQDNILVLNVFYELIVEGNAEVMSNFIRLRLLHGATIEHFFSCSCGYQTSRKGGDDITWILNEAIPVKPDVMNHMGWVTCSLGPRPKPTPVWIAFSIGCVILEAYICTG